MTVLDARGKHKLGPARSPVWLALWRGRSGHGPVFVRRLGVAGVERMARRLERARLRIVAAGGHGRQLGGGVAA